MEKKNNTDNTTQNEEKTSKKIPEEFGGQKGPEPTRYGDWEKNGRVSDF
ncbi:MAG: hypothetical protein DGJ47_000287 [Rickettsiaceae bacterium]